MSALKYKRNENLLAKLGEHAELVTFVRKHKGDGLIVVRLKSGDEISIPPEHITRGAKTKGKKKDGIRMLLAVCPECGYKIRSSSMWFEVAMPVCPNPDCHRKGEPFEIEYPITQEQCDEILQLAEADHIPADIACEKIVKIIKEDNPFADLPGASDLDYRSESK